MYKGMSLAKITTLYLVKPSVRCSENTPTAILCGSWAFETNFMTGKSFMAEELLHISSCRLNIKSGMNVPPTQLMKINFTGYSIKNPFYIIQTVQKLFHSKIAQKVVEMGNIFIFL